MRFLSTFLVLTALSAVAQTAVPPSSPASPQPAAVLRLADGSPVHVRLREEVSSAEASAGVTVAFEAVDELRLGDLVLLPRGASLTGSVVEAEEAKGVRRGRLRIAIGRFLLPDGRAVILRSAPQPRAEGQTLASAQLLTVEEKSLLKRGRQAVLPMGLEFTVYVEGDYAIDAERMRRMAAEKAAPAPPETKLHVQSTPGGATVEVDGHLAGQTPLILTLPSGEHSLRLLRAGSGEWGQRLKLTGGEFYIDAQLPPVGLTVAPTKQPTPQPEESLGDAARRLRNPYKGN